MGVIEQLRRGWNAFLNKDPTIGDFDYYGSGYSNRPDRLQLTRGAERTIITCIYNRMALDAASIRVQHCKVDEDGKFIEPVKSGLDNCLSLEANIDQTNRQFLQDVYMSMFDEGVVALVPTVASVDPKISSSFDIYEMRTAKIIQWYPQHVKVRIYNDIKGQQQEMVYPKRSVAIVENPYYAVMNEKNSTLQRLKRKLVLLDAVDEETSVSKLDLIVQLPYIIKSEARKKQAEDRRKEIERQLSGSKYGIAYTDGTEKITQLNRSLENNLMGQIEYLTSMLYSQLNITKEILDGTASEEVMENYFVRTIEPVVYALAQELKRKFLTKTARTQNQSIEFYRDPFGLIPVTGIAKIADVFQRNEVMTSNELRQSMGMKPSNDPKADELNNANMPDEPGQEGGEASANPFAGDGSQLTVEGLMNL